MINKSVNQFTKGLNTSSVKTIQPKDTYSYALNAVKEDSINNPSVITNEKGFTDYIDLGYDYILLGSIYLGKKDYVLFIKNIEGQTAFNRVILIEDKTITIKYNTTDLGFQDKYVIKGTYRINYKNQRIIYWVDGLNEDRVLNLDNTSTGNIDELTIDIKYKPAIVTSKQVRDDGGGLLTGTYEFFGSYKSNENAITPWFLLTANPIYIIDDNIESNTNYVSIDGTDSGLPTNKSINLNLANLDLSFNNFRLGIIKTINGVSTGYYVEDIYYNTTNKSYVYTGSGVELTIADISEFLVDKVKYYASNAIIQKENRLLRANTKTAKININYQQYANNIVTDYYIEEELIGSMADSGDYNVRSEWWKAANTKYSDKKSLLRGEVYSVGIAFGLLKEGVETEVYHIPGRAINNIPVTTYQTPYIDIPSASYSSTWDSVIVNENGETVPKWKVDDTALKSLDNTVNKPAYFESDQTYPDGFNFPITGSSNNGVNNTNIRHHKMPSAGLEPIFRTEDIGNTFNFYKRYLGLKFSNIEVPVELKDNIAYIRIYLTPRTAENNKSIIAKGMFINTSLTKINEIGNLDLATANQWVVPLQPYNDQFDALNGGAYTGAQDDGWNTNNYYHSFYSPDTTLVKSTINVNRIQIENESKGIVHYYNTLASRINADPYTAGSGGPRRDSASNGGYKRDLFYDDSNNGGTLPTGQTSDGTIYNITPQTFRSTYKSIAIFNQSSKVLNSRGRRRLKQAVYVPFDARLSTDQIGGMDNPYYSPKGPANVLLELNTSYATLGQTETEDTSVNFTDNDVSKNYNDPEQGDDKNGTFHFHTIANPLAVYRYGALKKDTPSQYGNIDGLEYNPTDLVIVNPTFNSSNILSTTFQGLIGDSWIDMFSVKRTRYARRKDYTFASLPEISIGISTFFTESNINHRLRYAEGVDDKQYYPKQILTTPIKTYLDAGFNINILNSDNYYKENPDFDKQVTKKNFGISRLDIDLTGIVSYFTRIIYSGKLLNESREDTYRTNLANDYIDLPKNRGFISNLFNKGQELYAITRDSLWKVFASNTTIKTSDGDISVGNGEFFSLEPVEVLSIDGGYAGSSSKNSLVETPYGYFYIDRYKGKFILFDEQQKDLALKDINEFINDNFKLTNDSLDFDLPLLDSGYIAGYDDNLKRLLITKIDYSLTTEQLTKFKGKYNSGTTYTTGDIYLKDNGKYYIYNNPGETIIVNSEKQNNSWTLSYNPILNQWISYHSYVPNNYMIYPNGLLAKRNDSKIKELNTGDYGKYFDNDIKPFIIESICNEYGTETKVFDSISVNLDSSNSDINNNKFFDKGILYTEYQCTGEITFNLSNLTKKERNWNFNKFSDITNNLNQKVFVNDWNNTKLVYPIDKVINVNKIDNGKPWYQRGRLRDKYVAIRFIENNINNDKLVCKFITCVYRKSQR